MAEKPQSRLEQEVEFNKLLEPYSRAIKLKRGLAREHDTLSLGAEYAGGSRVMSPDYLLSLKLHSETNEALKVLKEAIRLFREGNYESAVNRAKAARLYLEDFF